MASTNQGSSGATPTTRSKAEILDDVLALATQFSTCVEAFNLIHPSKDSSHAQKVALAKLGVQQGRLLIFGDAVGISSPPPHIAKHMVPSRPGVTNPDPTLPVNFGVRDPKLDEPAVSEKVRAGLAEITSRPANISREQLMEKYGLKNPKRFTTIEYPALVTNRLEAFREKYALLQDLVRQTGGRPPDKRNLSMTTQHWTVHNVDRFDEFVKTVRHEVDGLIALMGVKEQVDRGMRTDIKALGWHPDLYVPVVRQDWDKLRRIREACFVDYPEYIEVTDRAMKYISEDLKERGIPQPRTPSLPTVRTPNPSSDEKASNGVKTQEKEKDKRPGFLSHFGFKSWTKSASKRSPSPSTRLSPTPIETPRSKSEDLSSKTSHQKNQDDADTALQPVRSKSMSHVPSEPAPAPADLDARLESVPTIVDDVGIPVQSAANANGEDLMRADTVNSLIERHDMCKADGRIETKDIRGKAHDWAR